MKKCECMSWVRAFEETLKSIHHPHCEKRNIEEEAKKNYYKFNKSFGI